MDGWLKRNSGAMSEPQATAEPSVTEEPSATDEALVRAARLGDHEAFREIVDRHGPAMYRYALRLVGDATDAAEATQEAFVSAWRSLSGFAGHSSLRT